MIALGRLVFDLENCSLEIRKKFLQELVAKAPYKIKSTQVDGGSESMADFEDECSRLNIPFYVLPPATLEYDGGIERVNRTLRREFY